MYFPVPDQDLPFPVQEGDEIGCLKNHNAEGIVCKSIEN